MERIEEYEAMAKLSLSPDERGRVNNMADMIIKSFSKLEGIDTENVLPMVSVLDVNNVLREDSAQKTLSRDDILANAPEQYDGYFQVPKTID